MIDSDRPLSCVICLHAGADHAGKGTHESDGWSVCPDHVGHPITTEVAKAAYRNSDASYRMSTATP